MSDTRIYTNVTAEIVNAGDMSRSLTRSGGQIGGDFWLDWEPSGGITNKGWYTGFADLGLANWWSEKYESFGKLDGTTYSNDASGFQQYVEVHRGTPDLLKDAFSYWNSLGGSAQYQIITNNGFSGCFAN